MRALDYVEIALDLYQLRWDSQASGGFTVEIMPLNLQQNIYNIEKK